MLKDGILSMYLVLPMLDLQFSSGKSHFCISAALLP